MAENKTKPTKGSVTAFLNKINDQQLRDDCFAILKMMQKVAKSEPVMWGSAIVGFGTYTMSMRVDGKEIRYLSAFRRENKTSASI